RDLQHALVLDRLGRPDERDRRGPEPTDDAAEDQIALALRRDRQRPAAPELLFDRAPKADFEPVLARPIGEELHADRMGGVRHPGATSRQMVAAGREREDQEPDRTPHAGRSSRCLTPRTCAMWSRTPFTNAGDSALPKRRATSIASSMVTAAGISGCPSSSN